MKKFCCVFMIMITVVFVAIPGFSNADETGRGAVNGAASVTQDQSAPSQGSTGPGGGPAEPGAAKPVDPDKIIMRINGTPFTQRDLDRVMNLLARRKTQTGLSPEDQEKAKTKALDRIIFEELAYEEARRQGMKADPAEVEKDMDDLKLTFGGAEAFEERIKKDGLTPESMRADIEKNILLERIFKKEIVDKVKITQAQLEKEYEKQKDKFVRPEKVSVTDITLFLEPHDPKSMAKAKAFLKKISADKEGDLKKLPEDGTFSVQDIDLDKLKNKEIYKEAMKLNPGDFSGVIKTSDSLHIIRLNSRVAEKRSTFEQMKPYLEDVVRGEAQVKRAHEWQAELKKGAVIEILDK